MIRFRLRRTFVAAAAAATLALPGIALAASPAAPTSGSIASNPVPLTGSVKGSLAGNSGGSYEFLQFNYPGDGSTVTLNMTVDNGIPLQNSAAGFNIYQGSTLLAASSQNGQDTTAASFSSTTAGPILVQVFDYDPGNPIAFTLTPEGLPAASTSTATTSTATAAAASSAAPAAASNVLGASASGTLAANSGGSFAIYTLNYPGNSENVSLSLSVSPVDVVANNSVGINVYDQSGNLVTSAGPTADPAVLSLTLSNDAAATYTIQVFNYDPSNSVSYTLTQTAV